MTMSRSSIIIDICIRWSLAVKPQLNLIKLLNKGHKALFSLSPSHQILIFPFCGESDLIQMACITIKDEHHCHKPLLSPTRLEIFQRNGIFWYDGCYSIRDWWLKDDINTNNLCKVLKIVTNHANSFITLPQSKYIKNPQIIPPFSLSRTNPPLVDKTQIFGGKYWVHTKSHAPMKRYRIVQ